MIKRVNFTGRRRIPRDRVEIELLDGRPRTFNAAVRLGGMNLLSGAAVVLEAMCAGSSVIERFEFGEVDDVRPPADRRLKELESENVFFTLKVIDRTEQLGRLVGMAEHIRPEYAGKPIGGGRQGILAIEEASLGQELWRLNFEGPQVSLLINKEVHGLKERARFDPLFTALVYPAVVRQILREAIEENVEAEEEDDRWPVLWLRFGRNLCPHLGEPPKKDDPKDDHAEWIEEVVETFSSQHEFQHKFSLELARVDGGES